MEKSSLMDRTLNPEMLDSSPFKQFTVWFDEAVTAGLPEPNAMVLTTTGTGLGAAGEGGTGAGPHARTVLLKSHDAEGFIFYLTVATVLLTSRGRSTSRST